MTPILASMPSVLIATFYQFVDLPDFAALRPELLRRCEEKNIKGTIVLAAEGLNGTIAGAAIDLQALLDWLRADPRMTDLRCQQAVGAFQPFRRMKVRLKHEIVTSGVPDSTSGSRGIYVEPTKWNALIAQPDVVVIDVRNHYEVALGSFERAVDPGTRVFSELPRWIETQRASDGLLHGNPQVAMFCTGGIRCEKSTAYLRAQGIDSVFHLRGGILNYLERIPESQSLWHGECFVFDERISVRHGLRRGKTVSCSTCGQPVGSWERALPSEREASACLGCGDRASTSRSASLTQYLR